MTARYAGLALIDPMVSTDLPSHPVCAVQLEYMEKVIKALQEVCGMSTGQLIFVCKQTGYSALGRFEGPPPGAACSTR